MDTVSEFIRQQARSAAQAIYLVAPDTDVQLSFAELHDRVRTLGTYFDSYGISRGAKVAFLLDNGFWTTLVLLGTMASGRVVVPLNAIAGDEQLAFVLEHSDAEMLFIAPHYAEKLEPQLRKFPRRLQTILVDERTGPQWSRDAADTSDNLPPAASDPAMLLYTSGTTGVPKGALLSHRAIVSGGRNVAGGHALTATDRALCVLPVYHINGAIVTVAAPLVSGGSVVMPRRFSARDYWPLIAEHRCTWSSIVPTIVKYLLDRTDSTFEFGSDERLSSFRFARSATSALPAAMLREWESTFKVPIIETLGLTETAATVMTNPMPPAVRKAGSVGKPFGCEARIIDEHGQPVTADNVSGEILYRGANVMDSYYKNPQATKEALVDDGWFRSGDLGFRDAEGYYFITGRAKELIIRGGENIAPREIDDVLYRHAAVLEAAAVGVDDADYGQEVVACVVLRDGHRCSEEELKAFCADSVGAYKAPKRVYFMDSLPKGPSGKIQRLKLPELIDADNAGGQGDQ